MYLPPQFAEDDRETLYRVIREHGFGLLIGPGVGVPTVSHLPFLLEGDVLVSHMARANPHWRAFDGETEVLCVFQGPHAYVSPRWYDSEKMVPTWNYVVVHACGVPRIVDDPDECIAMQQRLAATHEAGAEAPWTMDGLPESHLDGMIRAIVNFEIPIDRIEGKFKLNQNRTAKDREGVIAALGDSPRESDRAVAALMAAREEG